MRNKKEYEKEYYLKNKDKIDARQREHNKKRKERYYCVYYLPEEHYCGFSIELLRRIGEHRRAGKNVDGWRILYYSKDKTEAAYHEALFQSVLSINGLNYK